jgi:hypothetical protein
MAATAVYVLSGDVIVSRSGQRWVVTKDGRTLSTHLATTADSAQAVAIAAATKIADADHVALWLYNEGRHALLRNFRPPTQPAA